MLYIINLVRPFFCLKKNDSPRTIRLKLVEKCWSFCLFNILTQNKVILLVCDFRGFVTSRVKTIFLIFFVGIVSKGKQEFYGSTWLYQEFGIWVRKKSKVICKQMCGKKDLWWQSFIWPLGGFSPKFCKFSISEITFLSGCFDVITFQITSICWFQFWGI